MAMTIKIQSESNPSVNYEIKRDERAGTFYCSCPAWKFCRSSVKTCKHLKTFVTAALSLGGFSAV